MKLYPDTFVVRVFNHHMKVIHFHEVESWTLEAAEANARRACRHLGGATWDVIRMD